MKSQASIQSFSKQKGSIQSLDLPESLQNQEWNKDLVHQVILANITATHQGTKAQKTRSEVRGGGAKPWKQKGTGRARAGTTRGPIWRTGGVTFAAKTNKKVKKVNKKMHQKAMMQILSHLLDTDRLILVDALILETPKTKVLKEKLNAMNINNACLVASNIDMNITLASRNIPNISLISAEKVTPLKLLKHKHIVMDKEAFESLTEAYSA